MARSELLYVSVDACLPSQAIIKPIPQGGYTISTSRGREWTLLLSYIFATFCIAF